METTDQYTYRVAWSGEDQEFVGTCVEFPGLSWLDGSLEAALGGVRRIVADCVRDMNESGEPAPEPIAARSYSGKFVVRVPPQLHRELATQAAESGISLNRLISLKLAKES
jgi:predicted HicB family RNase H-like nuclease